MNEARPLPPNLAQRYHGWKATAFVDNHTWLRRLAEEGQRPRVMVISCCDSRVNASNMFGEDPGEFFVHRNIAALVPPHAPDGDLHGTSAAVEYAVTALQVTNIIVLGHSLCGGVKGCHDMCAGQAPELLEKSSFVGRWMEILRPGYERVKDVADEAERLRALERQAVLTSINNLQSFPFVAERRAAGDLLLHGLWTDIAEGSLMEYHGHAGVWEDV